MRDGGEGREAWIGEEECWRKGGLEVEAGRDGKEGLMEEKEGWGQGVGGGVGGGRGPMMERGCGWIVACRIQPVAFSVPL